MARQLPSGTVTFLFTDVEGSTKLLHTLGEDRYAEALAEHRRLVRAAAAAHGGVEVDTQGDAFFLAFPTAPGALAAAAEASAALGAGPIRIRIGLHSGSPLLTDEGYVGPDVHKGARIAAAGHGDQVLVSAATAALLPNADLRDLGLHRLKDLTAAERIYQLGDSEHPPLKTLHQTNLPIPPTPFLGRQAELEAVGQLIARPEMRLITLTGPGGTGKTRLALQAVAEAVEAFPGGVWWVPLAALRDPALVTESAAKALGTSDDLAEHIGDKRLLLLLDNFEHLVAAAANLARLLAACPNLTLVVTSREPLHLNGEWEYAVDPLIRPDAVELFLTRAVAAKRDFGSTSSEVAAICERLDYLPLAIELAAARVKALSPGALLARLDPRLPLLAGGRRDAPERQRTLRATIEWSHELLTSDEQRLFRRLAVFRGGCTLETAVAVADADLDTLQSLVDKSLVRVRDDRFWMLETIRELAVERLDASGEADELRRRHAALFLSLAEEAASNLGGDPTLGLQQVDPEHDNMRAVFERLDPEREAEEMLRLALALGEYWSVRGHLEEGARRISSALAAYRHPTELRARALISTGPSMSDPKEDRAHAEEAIEIYERLRDDRGRAEARYALANALAMAGQWEEARDLMEESVQAFDRLREPLSLMRARRGLAWMHEELGELATFRRLTEENLVEARRFGIRRIEARSLGALAMIALDEGRIDEARELLAQSYAIDRSLENLVFISVDLVRFAALLVAEGHDVTAAQLLGRSRALREEIGWEPESWAAREFDRTLAVLRQRLTSADLTSNLQAGAALDTDAAVALALDNAQRGEDSDEGAGG